MTTHPQSPQSRLRINGKVVTASIILIVALVFVFSNLHVGTLRFLGWDFRQPTWIWFLIVLAAGILIGSLYPWLRPRRRR